MKLSDPSGARLQVEVTLLRDHCGLGAVLSTSTIR